MNRVKNCLVYEQQRIFGIKKPLWLILPLVVLAVVIVVTLFIGDYFAVYGKGAISDEEYAAYITGGERNAVYSQEAFDDEIAFYEALQESGLKSKEVYVLYDARSHGSALGYSLCVAWLLLKVVCTFFLLFSFLIIAKIFATDFCGRQAKNTFAAGGRTGAYFAKVICAMLILSASFWLVVALMSAFLQIGLAKNVCFVVNGQAHIMSFANAFFSRAVGCWLSLLFVIVLSAFAIVLTKNRLAGTLLTACAVAVFAVLFFLFDSGMITVGSFVYLPIVSDIFGKDYGFGSKLLIKAGCYIAVNFAMLWVGYLRYKVAEIK